jgi:hypothetical protein
MAESEAGQEQAESGTIEVGDFASLLQNEFKPKFLHQVT